MPREGVVQESLDVRPPRRSWRFAVYRWFGQRPTIAAAIVSAVLSLLVFCPGLVPGRTLSSSDVLWRTVPWAASAPADVPAFGANSELLDPVQQFHPFLRTTREALPGIPRWNPYIMGGRPYLANQQSAVFSLFSAPTYALPFWRSLALVAALKVFLAAFGTYLLGAALGMRFGGALLAGLCFAFSLWIVAWIAWPLSSVWVYLPWLCLLADRLARAPGPLPCAGLAAVVALQFFAGHPESSFHVMAFTVLFWTMRVIGERPATARAAGYRVLWFVCALGLGAALAAITLIPLFEFLQQSIDLDARDARGASHDPPKYLLGVFLHDFWGRQTRVNLLFPFSALEERAYYLGALPLMLATAALVLRPRWERLALATVAVCAVLVATGLGPVFDAVTALPGFDTGQNSRLVVLSVFCVALLVGWGLDDLAEGGRLSRQRRGLVLMTCSVLLLFPVSVMLIGDTLSLRTLGLAFRVAWGFADPARLSREPSPVDPGSLPLEPADPSALVHMASLLEWLVPATVGLGLVALRLGRRIGASTFVACALVLVAVDLFKADMGWNPAVPIAHATQPTTPAIRYLQARRPARFVAVKQPGFSPVPPFPPNVAMRYGLYDARGYDYPVERRYYELWHRYVSESPTCFFADCGSSVDVRREALHALGLLGVRYILQDSSAPPLAVSGLRLAYNGGDARIYSNSYALPRAFVVDREQLVADEAAARAKVGSPAFAGQSSVVTERHLDGLASGRRRGLPGRASIDTYAADRVVARTSASHRALLVLTDVWYPGWKAKVDGRTTPVRRVDYLLRGVTIPAGTHRVELTYEPPSWRAGWVVSLVALIAIVTIVLTGRRRPRREQRAA